jgi:hypothetical protein
MSHFLQVKGDAIVRDGEEIILKGKLLDFTVTMT